jgi:hypothetical protein
MSLTTHGGELENIAVAAQQDAGFEKILKFKKGEYFIGEEEIPLGTEYLAHVVGWTKCWIKFVDGEFVDRQTYRVALGEKPPEREKLDDLDESQWEKDDDGKPVDPWVYQYLLPFENRSNGELVIFVTPSVGGKRAIADLCQIYTRRVQKGGSGQPIAKLAKTDMLTKKWGKVPRPVFEVVGWDSNPIESSPPTSAPTAEPNTQRPSLDARRASFSDDMNDQIPF